MKKMFKEKARLISLLVAVALLTVSVFTLFADKYNITSAAGKFRASTLERGPFAQMTDDIPMRRANPQDPDDVNAATDRYLVKYKNNRAARTFKNVLDERIVATEDLGSCEVVVFSKASLPSALFAELEELNTGRYLDYIQPDFPIYVSGISSDDAYDSYDTPDISPDARPVVIALIDGCVDVDHPSLKNHIDERYRNFDSGVATNPEYTNMAHGTHVAGQILQTAALAGADVKLLPLQVFDRGVTNTSAIISALRFAKKCGAEVINLSLGSTAANIAFFDELEETKALIVTAAGNAATNLDEVAIYPGCYPLENIINVTSCNEDGGLSYFSNFSHNLVDLSAVGRNVISSLPGDKDGPMTGTSVSAATVSGAAAAVLSRSNIRDAQSLKNRLLDTADRLDNLWDKVREGRRLNLMRALSGEIDNAILSENPAMDFDTYGLQPNPGERYQQYALAGDVVQVSAGWDRTLLLKEDGSVWAFGNDAFGATGTCEIPWDAEHPQITKIDGLSDIVEIRTGAFHNLALRADGSVFSWGYNRSGELGDGSYQDSALPVQVIGLSGATSIAAGVSANVAVCDDGVWMWGDGAYEPYILPGLSYFEPSAVIAGAEHFLAKSGDAVYGLGENRFGEIGVGYFSETYGEGLSDLSNVRDLAAGYRFSVAVLEDYTAWSWGLDGPQLGLGETSVSPNPIVNPQQLALPLDVNAAAAGETHALVIDNTRRLWSWGRNEFGQLGVGDAYDRALPTPVLMLEDVIQVDAGRNHSVALDDNGQIWLWGSNASGQLGKDPASFPYADTPFILFEVDDTFLIDVKFIAAGYDHTLAIKNDGTLVAFGDNEHGQLSYPIWSLDDAIHPRVVAGLSDIVKVAAGDGFSLALDDLGNLWSWGRNDFGQLGRSFGTDDHTPTKIALTGVTDMAAGKHHVLAVTDAGLVYSWGRAYDYQLGVVSPGDKATPRLVEDLEDVIQVAAGAQFSLALKSDGSLYSWGSNVFGQTAQGDDAYTSLPQQIPELTDIIDIKAGGYHSLALTESGKLLSWGLNEYGQLGDGSFKDARAPRTVITADFEPLSGIAQIEAGEYQSSVVLEDGKLLSWGKNTHHPLGDRTTLHSPNPVEPIRLWYPVSQVACGASHSVALTQSGKLWSWGGNCDGQTGRPAWIEWNQPWERRWDDMDKPMRTMREQ